MAKYEFSKSDFYLFYKWMKDRYDPTEESTWVIKVNGVIYTTRSNKCGWKKQHHAKAAFRQDAFHLANQLFEKHRVSFFRDKNQLWSDYLSELEQSGVIEFVEIK